MSNTFAHPTLRALATQFLADPEQSDSGADPLIMGVAQSSKEVQPGWLFAALPGARVHGAKFIAEALANGAAAILTDSEGAAEVPSGIPRLVFGEPRRVLGQICDRVYGTTISGMRIFGVTGTNGKTSTATYLHWLLNRLQVSAGLSASTMRIIGQEVVSADLTTPEVSTLHNLLAQMRLAGNTAVALEVSAQALIRNRVDGIRFEVSGFTNLSRDHLDDFSDMGSYLEAKARLFEPEFSSAAVINVEDEFGAHLAQNVSIPLTTVGDRDCDWRLDAQAGSAPAFTLNSATGVHIRGSVTAGPLMAKNLALASVMLFRAGFGPDELAPHLKLVDAVVPGRLELISEELSPKVYLDYAHTPAAVAAAVAELGGPGWLTVVLGASGNRDAGKRPQMAAAAAARANLLIITDQHPRDEQPAAIRAALMAAAAETLAPDALIEEPDPAKAINLAIRMTPAGGRVLWCGPGHLKYREVAGQKVAFDAREIARHALLLQGQNGGPND